MYAVEDGDIEMAGMPSACKYDPDGDVIMGGAGAGAQVDPVVLESPRQAAIFGINRKDTRARAEILAARAAAIREADRTRGLLSDNYKLNKVIEDPKGLPCASEVRSSSQGSDPKAPSLSHGSIVAAPRAGAGDLAVVFGRARTEEVTSETVAVPASPEIREELGRVLAFKFD